MPVAADHDARVSAWIEHTGGDLPSIRRLEAFEHSFRALWARSVRTLGDATVTAIVDRVLHSAAVAHPTLPPLSVDASGLRLESLRKDVEVIAPDELVALIHFVLVEFLRVLGVLTSEVLTPALHHELSTATTGTDRKETP